MVTKRNMENTVPVFRLKPFKNKESAMVKYVGFVEQNDKLGDEIVELSKVIHPDSIVYGKHSIPVENVGEYSLSGRIYHCNVIASYLVFGYRIPLMYLTINYSRTLVSGSLFQLLVSLDIDKKEKNEFNKELGITNEKSEENNGKKKKLGKYINAKFTGKWMRHMDCDETLLSEYEERLLKLYRKNNEDDNFEEDIKIYRSIMNECEYEFTTMEDLRDYFVELCMSKKFHNLLEVAIECREKERSKEGKIDYGRISDQITNLSDLAKQLLDDGELIE
jgi:hypothetical protein